MRRPICLLAALFPLLFGSLLGGGRPAAAAELAPLAGAAGIGAVRLLLPDDFAVVAAFEHGFLHYGDLADFTGYRNTSDEVLDRPRYYRYSWRDEVAEGFRLGLRFRDQLDLVWSRLDADSRYRAWMDGEERVDDPDGLPPVELPRVDIRLDLITLAWRVESLQWRGLAPSVRLGFGWILHSQEGPMRGPFRLPQDYSDNDRLLEGAWGAEWRWRRWELGGEIRAFTFRFDPEEDPFTPAEQVWSWMWSLRAAASF